MQVAARKKTGAFQALPLVPNAEEHLNAALKRAARVMPSTKLKNEAAKARNKASRKMDGEHVDRPLSWPCLVVRPFVCRVAFALCLVQLRRCDQM